MKLTKKTAFLTCILLGLGGLVYTLFYGDQVFAVHDTEVLVSPSRVHISIQEQVRKRVMVKLVPLSHRNMWSFSLENLQASLMSDPWLDSLTVVRQYPSKLKVAVKLKTIALIYIDSRGRVRPITEGGELLDSIDLEKSSDVPVVRNSDLVKNTETLVKMIELIKTIPTEGFINQKEIAEVDWNDRTGLSVELIHRNDGFILLGHENVRQKIKRVSNVLKYLESQKQRWRVIDASFSKKVLVRLRKHS